MKKIFKTVVFCAFICAAFFMPAKAAYAHPHVFIDTAIEFVWQGKKLQGAYIEWTFDKIFSNEIISWLDADHNGKFSDAESEAVYNNAFINLRNYFFYTFIRQGTKRSNPEKVSKFKATQKNGIMTYRFYVDLSKYTGTELYFAVYDYTYFCDVRYIEDGGIRLTYDPAVVNPTFKIIENKDYPVFYDPLSPAADTSVYYKWKPGLQTYYPKEILLSW